MERFWIYIMVVFMVLPLISAVLKNIQWILLFYSSKNIRRINTEKWKLQENANAKIMLMNKKYIKLGVKSG